MRKCHVRMRARPGLLVGMLVLMSVACSSGRETASGAADTLGSHEPASTPATAQAAQMAASTNLDVTPLSAADYAMYAGIMSGASALLANLDQDDRTALALAKAVEEGRHKPTAADETL